MRLRINYKTIQLMPFSFALIIEMISLRVGILKMHIPPHSFVQFFFCIFWFHKIKQKTQRNRQVHTYSVHIKCFSNIHRPFSSGAFLYFSNRLTAIASNRTRAAGYSFRTSHISFLLNTNRSLQPTDRTLAVLRLPIHLDRTCVCVERVTKRTKQMHIVQF